MKTYSAPSQYLTSVGIPSTALVNADGKSRTNQGHDWLGRYYIYRVEGVKEEGRDGIVQGGERDRGMERGGRRGNEGTDSRKGREGRESRERGREVRQCREYGGKYVGRE